MAQPGKATPETVQAAIAALEARQEPVTLQAVRAEIGGGSLGTIQPIVKAWREGRAAIRPREPDAAEGPEEPPELPARVAQALDSVRASLDPLAAAVAEAIGAAAMDERRRARLEQLAETEAVERRVAELSDRVRQAESESDQLARDAVEVEADRDRLARQLEDVTQERDGLAVRLAGQDQAVAALTAERDRLATDLQGRVARLAELDADLAGRQSEVERLAREIQAARSDYAAERERNEHLHGETAEARAAQARAEAQRDAAEAKAAELRALLDRLGPPRR